MAQLVLGQLTGDTLRDFANYIEGNANGLNAATDAFINDLLAQREEDFSSIGDLDTLNLPATDSSAEIAQLFALRPSGVILDFSQLNQDFDRLNAEVTPAEPALNLPTAAIPTLDAERPQIVLPDRPDTDVGLAPSDAPVLDEVTVPDAPVFTLPNVPTFEELQLPVSPSFSLPTFAAESPSNLLAPPTNDFAYVDAGYTSALRDPITAKLLHDLENGGYGIEPGDETALWMRANDRAEQAARTAIEQAHRRAANTSFPLPQGALFADMELARRQAMATIADASRDIALKRADLYVENRRFTITEVRQLEQLSIALYNAIQERALNFAKSAADVGIAIYDASVRNFNAQLDAYKTEAQVFEVRVRAELAKAELFKAQIEAEKLRGEFNLQRVSLYQSQLNGIQSIVNLYKTRVDATSALTDVQRNKLEVFKARIDAFGMRVRAKASEYDMFRSAVQGETAKLEIYRTDIAAHESRLRGEELRVRTLLQGNESRVQQFRAAVDRYNSRVSAIAKSAEGRMDLQRVGLGIAQTNVLGYRAMVDAITEGVRSRQTADTLNNNWSIATLNSHVEAAKMRLEQMKLTINSRVEIDKFGAKFYGDPLTATLASLNGLSVKSE